MAVMSQNVTEVMLNKFNKVLTKSLKDKVADEIGKTLVSTMQARIMANIDVNGKPFKAYTPKYAAWKAKFLGLNKGAIRKANNKAKLSIARLINLRVPKFQARDVNDKIRLTGRLLNSINYKVIRVFSSKSAVSAQIRIYVDSSKEKQVLGLTKNGYLFFGQAAKGTHWHDVERNAVEATIRKYSKGNLA